MQKRKYRVVKRQDGRRCGDIRNVPKLLQKQSLWHIIHYCITVLHVVISQSFLPPTCVR